MNRKKGFTLVELLAVIVILAIILAIAIPGITNIINSSRNKAYAVNEDFMVRAAKLYFSINTDSYPLNVGDTATIDLNVLKNEKLISSIKDPSSKLECDGNVLVKKISDSNFDYYPYLSCGSNYESEKYITNGLIANYKLDGNALDSTTTSNNGTVYGAIPVKDRKSASLLNNGDFASDINSDGKADNWTISNNMTNSAVNNNTQYATAIAAGGSVGYVFNNIVGHTYYYTVEVKSDSSLVNLNNGFTMTSHSGSGNFEKLSWLRSAPNSGSPHRTLYDSRSSGWTEIRLKNAQYYDLTDMFGSGKEPAKTWCDANLTSDNSKAYMFDGIDDYIELPDSSALRMATGGTISAWIYPVNTGENGAGRIVDKSTGTGGENGYIFLIYPNNTLYFQINASGATISTNNSVILNAWNYVAVTFNSSGRKIYVNGIDVTGSGGTTAVLPPNVSGIVTIGNRSGTSDRTFNGNIDDVRFYNRVLSATEIKNNYDIEK